MLKQIVTAIQIILAVLLVLVILLQPKGSGLSAAFGGGGESYRSKKGLDKTIFILTIALAAAFLVSSIARMLIAR